MEGVNKKLLVTTIVLALILVGLVGFMAGSYFGGKKNGNEQPQVVTTPPSGAVTEPGGTTAPSGTTEPSSTTAPSGTDKPAGTDTPAGTDKPSGTLY